MSDESDLIDILDEISDETRGTQRSKRESFQIPSDPDATSSVSYYLTPHAMTQKGRELYDEFLLAYEDYAESYLEEKVRLTEEGDDIFWVISGWASS